MKKDLWLIITLVAGFLGFMLGYSVPPFIEVGIGGSSGHEAGAGPAAPLDEELMKQYQQLYQTDE